MTPNNVARLSEYRPHLSGEAFCHACKHRWAAVVPVGTFIFECQSCHRMFGTLYGYVALADGVTRWVCATCGCDLWSAMLAADGSRWLVCCGCGAESAWEG